MSSKGKKARLKKLSLACAAILLGGLVYFLFVSVTGFGIPCPINFWTGLKCPGCGITTMIIELGHFNFEAAFLANPLTFCLLPVIAALIIYMCFIYVKHGSLKLPKWLSIVLIGLIIAYVIFGIVRNFLMI